MITCRGDWDIRVYHFCDSIDLSLFSDETVKANDVTNGLNPFLSQSDEKKDSGLSQTPYPLSTSSSVSFIHLSSQLSQDNQQGSKNTQAEQIENNKQTNELILSTKQPVPIITQLAPSYNSTLLFPDFTTPTNPIETGTAFLTDIDTHQSVASVQPHTLDFGTMTERGDISIQPFSDNYQVQTVPSHYTIDVSKGEEDEDIRNFCHWHLLRSRDMRMLLASN